MSLFGVELNNQVNRLITDIRLTLQKNKFIPNIRTIYRSFVQVDPQVSGALAPHLFEKVDALRDRHLTKTEYFSRKSI